jgi:amino acid adenylation domain-containing protein/thioester reductase-like protein
MTAVTGVIPGPSGGDDVRARLARALGVVPGGERRAPLSFAQERLWFLDRLMPGQPTYNMPFAARIRGPLDREALRRALDDVLQRQSALRTTVDGSGSTPVQVVHPPSAVPLVIVRVPDHLAGKERRKHVRSLLAAEASRPFDLATGPLLRALLVIRAEDDHDLLLTMHHLVADAWSVGLILEEISQRYAAAVSGTPAELPDLPMQYADHAVRQRAHLDSELSRHLAYWTEHLAAAPPVLELPSSHPRPPVQSAAGGHHVAYLDKESTSRLAEVCGRNGSTLFMGVLAAYQVVLSRLTGQHDIVVGTPVAGRTHADLDAIAGLFVNTLALRTSLANNPSFTELLGRVRETTLNGLEHQDLPFERLVEALAPDRSLGHAPVAQVQLVFQAERLERLRLAGTTVRVRGVFTDTSKVDLTVYAEVEPDGRLALVLEYRTDLFDSSWARRFAGCLLTVLDHAGAEPATRIGDLRLLPDDQWHDVVTAPNVAPPAAPVATPWPTALHCLRARPASQIEITGGHEKVSLAEILDRAARIGAVLQRNGVGAESPVGLCVDRSPGMLAALLGVWAAGGSYVPLDPGFPVARLQMMAQDSGLRHLVTERALGEFAAAVAPDARRVDIDGAEVAQARPLPEPSRVHPAQAAYTIFTSGSTGRPKGVTVPHRAVTNLLESFHRTLDLGPADCVVAVTTLSFDIALLELLLPLRAGARLVIADKAQAGDPALLRRLLVHSGASALQATPATWRMLLTDGVVPNTVRLRLCGGEALPRDLADELIEPGVRLWNVYGPTETTVWSAAGVVAPSPASIEVGPPIATTGLYVLDRRGHPLPRGVVGELCIGGIGVARGYLRRPGQTADRFVPDPFSAVGGARLYRTGDLARWLPNGRLEVLGRIDHQVKIRGFRIEIGEIESVLATHPAVREAVVVVDGDPDNRYLVTYVVPVDGTQADVAELLGPHLRTVLPEYMVPALFVPMAELPLTPNAKVDRSALRRPEGSTAAATDAAGETPLSGTETELAVLWRELLPPGTTVRRHDNFFAIGGHSMSLTRLIARIRADYGVAIEVREAFVTPTLAGMAARLRDHPDFRGQAPTPVDVPATDGADPLDDLSEDEIEALLRAALARRRQRQIRTPTKYPATPSQRQLWFLDALEPGQPTYTMAGAWRLRGALQVALLRKAFEHLVDRHAAFRTTFATDGDDLVQVVAPKGTAALDVVECADQVEADNVRRQTAEHVFDLAAGPLVRAVLARVGDREHELTIAVHHAVFDEWSWAVTFGDLAELYRALCTDEAPRLPTLTPHAAGHTTVDTPDGAARVADALEYWRDELDGAPELIDLPTDRPRPPVATRNLGTHSFELPAAAREAVARLRRRGYTPYQILVTAWSMVLARTSGQSDIVVGSVVGNRPEPDMANRVGMFVSTVALRLRHEGGERLGAALDSTRRVCLDALAHADAPFEQVTAQLKPSRSASYHPVFQVMFVLTPPGGADELAGTDVEPLPVQPAGARFDLTLVIAEQPGRLAGRLDYNTDLFDERTVRGLAGRLSMAVAALGADPDRRLADVSLLEPGERQELMVGGQPTLEAYRRAALVPRLIVEQAARTPGELAVATGDEDLDYRTLLERAQALAARLRSVGVTPETVVGLALPASCGAISAVLGVLHAGGAYLPLDGTVPPKRLRDLLADAQAPVLVTTRAWTDRFDGYPGSTICVEDLEPVPDVPHPSQELHPEHPAYVVYTSGSTGRPKGVVVSHAAARNLALTFRDRHGFRAGDRILMVPPLFFDASVGDILPALIAGATLVLHPDPAALTGPGLLRFCAEQAVTTVDAPSSLWQRWVEDLAGTDHVVPSGLTRMMVGGEPVPVARVREWAQRTGGRVRLYNHYGPTEATVCATTYDTVDGHELNGLAELPIGSPLPNTRVYVLDRRGDLVLSGAVGELCIGGAGVARGYLGRPGVTAAAFVPDPFATEPGARMYRTGDLARWGAPGRLEFLGRRDGQLKIRGRRIEVGEVEAAIGRHPEVRQVAVTAHAGPGGSLRLVAHVAPVGPGVVSGPELRAFLRERLPEYLIPSSYLLVPALPVTRNGKLDRAALLAGGGGEVGGAIDRAGDGGRPAYSEPRTPAERAIAQIFSDALEVARVGRADGFIDLGGHSLMAATVLAKINEACGVTLPLRVMFDTSTLEALAAEVDAARNGTARLPAADAEVDLRAEAVLPADIRSAGSHFDSAAGPERILLTGPTGFLGAFLLDELLRRTNARVLCLVRAESVEQGRARLAATRSRWGLGPRNPADDEYWARIDVVPGDLGAARLGLSDDDYTRAVETVDVVFHSGGQVNFIQPYGTLRPANVAGTVEVLRLAATGRPSAVHYVSTLGVFLGSTYAGRRVDERDRPADPTGIHGGYNQSKWVADSLVRQAVDRGVPVTIHRPARITGHSTSGVGNTDDYFSSLVKAFVELGVVPVLAGGEDMAPVDYVAAGICRMSLSPLSSGRSFHYYNQRTISYDQIAAELTAAGFRAERADYRDWRSRIRRGVADGTVTSFAPYAAALPDTEPDDDQPRFDCTSTELAAAQHGLVCPPADGVLLRRQLNHWVGSGFLRARTAPG